MKWLFPAKTFLIGEYIALQGGQALILTTTPCFEVSLEIGAPKCDFPMHSPAYNLWKKHLSAYDYTLNWQDPYLGLGGLGASSAQFLGAYYAQNYLQKNFNAFRNLIANYLEYAWNGKGMPPSGYDLIAQSNQECVYIAGNQNLNLIKDAFARKLSDAASQASIANLSTEAPASLRATEIVYKNYAWPFLDLAFILLHTGKKQATHVYLQNLNSLENLDILFKIAKIGCDAFKNADSISFINAINGYYAALSKLNLVANHTLETIKTLQTKNDILAAKGCGALGADILLLIVKKSKLLSIISELESENYKVIATNQQIFKKI